MLIGQYYTKIDYKGRTALPARYRKELGEEVVISRWYENSLAVFALKSWERVIDILVGETLLIAPTRDTERFLLGSAFETRPDAQGRIILPLFLREHARLKNDVVFLGLKDRVEIWSKQVWDVKDKEINKNAGRLIEEVQKIKIQSIKRQ